MGTKIVQKEQNSKALGYKYVRKRFQKADIKQKPEKLREISGSKEYGNLGMAHTEAGFLISRRWR